VSVGRERRHPDEILEPGIGCKAFALPFHFLEVAVQSGPRAVANGAKGRDGQTSTDKGSA
jgi:hypothetical protein